MNHVSQLPLALAVSPLKNAKLIVRKLPRKTTCTHALGTATRAVKSPMGPYQKSNAVTDVPKLLLANVIGKNVYVYGAQEELPILIVLLQWHTAGPLTTVLQKENKMAIRCQRGFQKVLSLMFSIR